MLRLTLDPSSVAAVSDHIQNVRERVLVGIRLGMRDAMQGLAQHTAEEAPHGDAAAPVHLSERILQSPEVVETPDQVIGTVGPHGFGKRILGWLESGTQEPAVNLSLARQKYARIQEKIAAGKRVSYAAQIYRERKRAMIYDPTHTHNAEGFFSARQAYSIAPRPFMQRSLDEYAQQIVATIQERLEQAETA